MSRWLLHNVSEQHGISKDKVQELDLSGLPFFPMQKEATIALANDHSRAFIITVSVTAGILLPLIIVGNFVVIIAIIKEIRKGHASYSFLLSLAVTDLLIGIVPAPFYVYEKINGFWGLGKHLCTFWLIADWAIVGISQLTIFLITLDRYLKCTFPVKYRNWATPKKINAVIYASWVLCLLFYPPFMILIEPPEGHVYLETECIAPILTHQWFGMLFCILQFWIPTFLKIFFYWRIYKTTARLSRQASATQSLIYSKNKNKSTTTSTTRFDTSAATKDDIKMLHGTQSHASTGVNNNAKGSSHRLERIGSVGFNYNDSIGLNIQDSRGNALSSSVDPQCEPMNTPQTQSKQEQDIEADTLQAARSPALILSQNKKALFRITLILGAYLLFSLPLATLFVMNPFCESTCAPDVVYDLFYGFYYINSALNPFLYAKASKDIWNSMVKIFLCKR